MWVGKEKKNDFFLWILFPLNYFQNSSTWMRLTIEMNRENVLETIGISFDTAFQKQNKKQKQNWQNWFFSFNQSSLVLSFPFHFIFLFHFFISLFFQFQFQFQFQSNFNSFFHFIHFHFHFFLVIQKPAFSFFLLSLAASHASSNCPRGRWRHPCVFVVWRALHYWLSSTETCHWSLHPNWATAPHHSWRSLAGFSLFELQGGTAWRFPWGKRRSSWGSSWSSRGTAWGWRGRLTAAATAEGAAVAIGAWAGCVVCV